MSPASSATSHRSTAFGPGNRAAARHRGTTRKLNTMLGDDAYRELSQLAPCSRDVHVPAVRSTSCGLMGSCRHARPTSTTCSGWMSSTAGRLVRLALPRGSAHGAGRDAAQFAQAQAVAADQAGTKFHAFDWRLGIDALARGSSSDCMWSASRMQLVGHCMGGLVARSASRWRMADLASRADRRPLQLVRSRAALRGVCPRAQAGARPQAQRRRLSRLIFRTLPSLRLLPSPLRAGPRSVRRRELAR